MKETVMMILGCIVALCFAGAAADKTVVAALGDAPYQVSIWQTYESALSKENKTVFVCAGALVTTEWVLTTITCLDKAENGHGLVRLAAGHLSNYNASDIALHDALEVYRHEQYDIFSRLHDIALIKVSPAFVESAQIKPVAVRANTAALETGCTVSGWQQGNIATSDDLKVMQVRHLNKTSCSFMLESDELKERLLCAGISRDEAEATCNVGDLGGPLVCEGQLAGIFSNPNAVCITPSPSVYLDVSFYLPWINYVMGGELTSTQSTTTVSTTHAPTPTTTPAPPTTPKPTNEVAALGDVPYHVSIWQEWKFAGETHISFVCAGTLVDKEFVLTSVRCLEAAMSGKDVLKLSAGHLTNENQAEIIFHDAAEVIKHEDYDSWSDANDIALVKVTPPFEESAFIKPVAIRTTPAALDIPCKISGWREDYFETSKVLKMKDVTYLNKTRCQFIFQEDAEDNMTICAGIPKEDPAAICNVGEDGGPLVCDGQLTGIFSGDNMVCVVSHPAVYTDVAFYHEWILARIPSRVQTTTTGVLDGGEGDGGAAAGVAHSLLTTLAVGVAVWLCNF